MKITRRNFIKLLAGAVIAQSLPLTAISKLDRLTLSISNSKKMSHRVRSKVMRIYSAEATFWDYKTEPYVNFMSEEVVDQMLKAGLCSFTGTSSATEAWQKLMPTYRNGDKVAIKPNLNALHLGYERNITVTPPVINSIISSLVNDLGVSPSNIYVYDLCDKPQVIERILKHPVNCVGRLSGSLSDKLKMHFHFGLNTFDSSATIQMRHPVYDADGKRVYCSIPRVVTQADHLINVPVLKAHQFILLSSAFKNHFGTVRFSNHSQYPTILHGDPLQPSLVDIYKNKQIKDKTRLILVDGLFGAPLYGKESFGQLPTPWHTFPGDKTPNSIFLSTDPVAIESVIADYIAEEQSHHNLNLLPHDYLHLAAKEKLGVHEHRKSDGTYSLIEYTEVNL